MATETALQRRVDFLRNREDMMVLIMGSLGLATVAIQARTGLSVGQVQYRLKKGGVSRAEYRNGNGMAGYALKACMERAEARAASRLK